MNKSIQPIYVGLIVGLTMGLSSCGGPSGTTSPATLLAAVQSALPLTQGLRLNAAPSMSSLPGFSGVSFAGLKRVGACDSVQTPTPTVDADSDGIPAVVRAEFDCKNETYGDGNTYSRSGYYEFKDQDETKQYSDGGWTGVWDYKFIAELAPSGAFAGGTYEYKGVGEYSLIGKGNKQVYNAEYNGEIGFEMNAGRSGSYTYSGVWETIITPSTAPTYLKGAIEFEGTWRITGVLPEDEDHHGKSTGNGYVDAEILIKSDKLKYNATCGAWYESGSIFYNDISGGKLELRFNCTDYDYYYNGKLWDPAA